MVFDRKEEAVVTLLISLLTLTVFLALYVFRSFDDSRLTSWQWTVPESRAGFMFLMLLAGIALTHALSGIALPRRWVA